MAEDAWARRCAAALCPKPAKESRDSVTHGRPELQLRMAFRGARSVDIEEHQHEQQRNAGGVQDAKHALDMQSLNRELVDPQIDMPIIKLNIM